MDSDFKSKWEFHCWYLIFFSLFTGDHFQRLELFSPGFCPSCLRPLLIVLLFPTCLVSPGPRCLVSSLCIKALFSLLPLGCSSLLMWSLQTFESVVFHAFWVFFGVPGCDASAVSWFVPVQTRDSSCPQLFWQSLMLFLFRLPPIKTVRTAAHPNPRN